MGGGGDESKWRRGKQVRKGGGGKGRRVGGRAEAFCC